MEWHFLQVVDERTMIAKLIVVRISRFLLYTIDKPLSLIESLMSRKANEFSNWFSHSTVFLLVTTTTNKSTVLQWDQNGT